MTPDEERQAVIAEALTWQRTPHHNGACIKGVGVDCGKFPWSVYHAVLSDRFPPVDERLRYRHDLHMHRDEEWYKNIADENGTHLPDGVLPSPGDFALYKIGRIFSHGAIVIKWPRIIHANYGIGVMQDQGDQGHLARASKVIFYTLWKT